MTSACLIHYLLTNLNWIKLIVSVVDLSSAPEHEESRKLRSDSSDDTLILSSPQKWDKSHDPMKPPSEDVRWF